MSGNEIDALLHKWDAERTSTKETRMTATDQQQRALLISAGEHVHAIKRLKKSVYTAEEYLQAVEPS
jgi:hypothetical protein